MKDDKEKSKSAWYGSQDLLGGVRMGGVMGEAAAVIPFLDRSGGRQGSREEVEDETGKKVREVVGENWSLKVYETVLLSTIGDFFTFQNRTPRLSCTYSRGFGHLMEVHLGVSDLIKIMVEKGLASQQDLMVMQNFKGNNDMDLAVSLVFRDDGHPALFLSKVQLLPSPRIVASKKEQIEANQYGFVPGLPHYHWLGNFEAFQGKLGIEVDGSSVVLFYRVGESRLDFSRISRELIGLNKFDRLVQQRMPSGEEIERLKEKILGI